MLFFREFEICVPDTMYKISYEAGRKFIDIREWYKKENGAEGRTFRGIYLLKSSLRKLLNMRVIIGRDFDDKQVEVDA